MARRISVSPRRINEIVHGKRAITADTALRLARFFGTSEQFWLALQNRYDLEVADPLPRREGCPSPTYRRFRYAASPLSPHLRHFAIAGDRVVRAARGRPAQPSDPALP